MTIRNKNPFLIYVFGVYAVGIFIRIIKILEGDPYLYLGVKNIFVSKYKN